MKTKKLLAKRGLVSLLLVLAMTLVGCGSVKTDDQVSGEDSGNSQTVTKAETKNPYSDEIKIGFVPNVIGDSVAAAWAKGAEQELSVYDNVTFQTFDGKASAETQTQIISDLITQNYDAIILQASDSAALASSVKQAEAAGIPVITLNLDADTPHAGLIAMVDYEAGKLVAQKMAEGMNDAGKVVIIQATAGATRGENLESGFRDEMANHSNIEILDAQSGEWLTEKANIVMNDFLTKYSQIDGVFCHNDAMAEGASQAAEAAGRLEGMQIWGADGESKALEYIEQGKMTGTIYTNCFDQGATAARLAMYLIGSETVTSSYTKTPVIKMAPIVVTPDTVGSIGENIRW